ncbi:MAG: GTP-binding protein [Erysipelotrichaceae bacterium]|nr:GTP-binding protein [Erysipelotrichaceae bacterium]
MTRTDVFSGFLGAGKTTLIQKLIQDVYRHEKTVIIENEFGEIGIDGGFLEASGIEVREINSGCICCSLQGDFEESLKKVLETYHPDRIVIEPSGVGKLSDVIKAIEKVDGLEINSACTVVDAARAKVYSRNFGEFFNDQIASAGCVILSRTQLVSDEKLHQAVEIVKAINPKARIVTTPWDELTGKAILKVMEGAVSLMDEHEHHHHDEHCDCGSHEHHHHDEHCDCGSHEHHHHDEHCDCGSHEHHHHDEHCDCGCHEHEHYHHDEHCDCGSHEHHHHDEHCDCGSHEHHHHADEVFTSVGFETIRKFTKEELESILSKLDEQILRAKGIVKNAEGGWLFFDYVPGDADVREGSANYTGLITVIGSKVDEQELKKLFGVE